VLLPVETCGFVASSNGINQFTERGVGGFGSTGDH